MSRKILFRVTAPTVAIGIVLLATCLVSAWYINRLQANLANILKENVSSLRAAQQLEIGVRQLRFHCFHYLIEPSEALRALIAEDDATFELWLAQAKASVQTANEREYVGQIEEGYDRYREDFEKLSSQVTPDKPRRDFRNLIDANPVKHIVDPCQFLLTENEEMMNVTAEESTRMSQNLGLAMLFLGLIGPIGGLLSGYGIARGLSRSLYRLSVRVQDMASQFDHDVAAVKVTPADNLYRRDGMLQDVVRQVEKVTLGIQKQQRELLRAEQLATVGKLAACVAHEIRNPLAAMKLLVSIALRPRNAKPLREEDLRVIHDEICRLEQTAQNLLDFARVTPPERSPCDLRDVVHQAAELVRARAGLQGVEITLQLPKHPVTAELDRNQWSTVLVNLFFNSLDAMPKGGKLELDLGYSAPGEILLRVSDTGTGIVASIHEALFTPFASSKPSGTGLGLSISRRVVEEHGGRIAAHNRPQEQGAGACFTINLPVAEDPKRCENS